MGPRLSSPPDSSCFEIGESPEGLLRVAWRSPLSRGPRWFGVGFLLVWLCGWAAGEFFAGAALLGLLPGKNNRPRPAPGFANLFLLVWLAFWTLGGLAAMLSLAQLLRRSRPESLTFGADELVYDPGTQFVTSNPWQVRNTRAAPRLSFPGAKVRTIPRECFKTLRLERIGDGQRLTVDMGADRVEIGAGLREPEREWLEKLLREWAGV
jgi:hypothetical protein